jgi:hypothetical protein
MKDISQQILTESPIEWNVSLYDFIDFLNQTYHTIPKVRKKVDNKFRFLYNFTQGDPLERDITLKKSNKL